jgi:hypothetical protein
MVATNGAPEANGLRVSIDQSTGKGTTTLRFYFRRRLSATDSKESRRTNRGWSEVRSSQPASQPERLAGNKAKIEPKTVQGILRHSKVQTTLDPYTQEDSDEIRAAQGGFLSAVGMSTTVNEECGLKL